MIPLDTLTDNSIISPQYISGEPSLLVFLNEPDNSIYLYDYSSDTFLAKRKFNSEGSDAIQMSNSRGYQFVNKDTLFIIDRDNLFVLDQNNDIINKIKLQLTEVGNPMFSPIHYPLTMIDEKIVIENFGLGFFELKCKYIISDNGDISYRFPIPKKFIDGFTGLDVFGRWNFAYNKQQQRFIYNFANLEHLYILDHDFNLLDSVLVRSKYFLGPPDKLHSSKLYGKMLSGLNINPRKYEALAQSRHYYSLILYDQYRNVYYRLVGFPIPEDDIQSRDPERKYTRQFSIMVLDEQFNTLSEHLLPRFEYLLPQSIFISEEGLNIQKIIDDEDLMHFDVFDFNKKQ
ncbi:MAG: DUF4221 family protein [Saprospiraceae bacterium]|nr:DUF4221 family protein [Saprospiraceae bacterium]